MSSTSFLNRNDLSAGLRNNNPGNLRPLYNDTWAGELLPPDTRLNFSRFKDVEHGIRAMFIDLLGDIVDDKDNTIRKLTSKYAPPSDHNQTNLYIQNVSRAVGISPDTVINPTRSVMFKIIRAKVNQELGPQAKLITNDAINTGIDYALLRADIKKKLQQGQQ